MSVCQSKLLQMGLEATTKALLDAGNEFPACLSAYAYYLQALRTMPSKRHLLGIAMVIPHPVR